MEDNLNLNFNNTEKENVEAQQFSENYLIDPEFLFSNTEKAVTSLGDANLPQSELINKNASNFVNNLEIKYIPPEQSTTFDNINNELNYLTKTNTKNIEYFTTKKTNISPMVLDRPKDVDVVTRKEIQKIVTDLGTTINPALKNLYSSVSAMMEKGKDPKGFTELRPTYNGDAYFFSDELKKTSKKVSWA